MTRFASPDLVTIVIPIHNVKMIAWLRIMLPVLAVAGLMFGSVTASARAPAMEVGLAMAAHAPCCAHKSKALPDCYQACPLIALCMASSVADMPTLSKLTLRTVTRGEMVMPASESIPESRISSPPARPPRS